MAYTQQQLDSIEEAIASGVLEVTSSDGKRVRYQSLKDLLAARDLIAAKLAPANVKPSTSYVSHRGRES